MAHNTKSKGTANQVSFLAGFVPISDLWAGNSPMYPSEQAVRWARRTLDPKLAQAKAVAIKGRELMVHPQRWAEVAEREAFSAFEARAAARQKTANPAGSDHQP